MVVLIAPNAFKGSLTALQAARALRRGVRRARPGARTILLPISDGGDGLIEALLAAKGGRRVSVRVVGPLGEPRRASLALLEGSTAVVEMALASGLALMGRRRDPLGATSYGTGQLIRAAMEAGARTILVGLGGSATNDGGAGMAQALGAGLLDDSGREIGRGARELLRLSRIEWKRPRSVRVVAISDVKNPLLGPLGSARVFGPQKGATPAMVRAMEKALSRYARIVRRDLRADVAALPGAGAAGGLGAGLAAFLGAELRPGASFVLKETGADRLLAGADAALTGEGRLDRTSFFGKAPVEFARRGRRAGVPVYGVFGEIDAPARGSLAGAGFTAAMSFSEAGARGGDSFRRAAQWAAETARRVLS